MPFAGSEGGDGTYFDRLSFPGIVTFSGEGYQTEYMCLYTADGFEGTLSECDEGELCWIEKEKVFGLNLWDGDRVFLELVRREEPFFSLKLCYDGNGALVGSP